MPRYINIDDLNFKDYVTVWKCNCSEHGEQTVMAIDDLNYLPTADVQEIRHGKWDEIRDADGHLEGWIHRSCGRMSMGEDNYCPKCGAKMGG